MVVISRPCQSREGQAGFDALAIHQHRAGAALAEPTTFFGAGEMQVLAECIQQRGPRIEWKPMLVAVDSKHGVNCAWFIRGRCCSGR